MKRILAKAQQMTKVSLEPSLCANSVVQVGDFRKFLGNSFGWALA